MRWLALLCVLGLHTPALAAEPDPDNTLYLDLDAGRVTIQMHPDWAPKTVARIKHLVRGGFYDGVPFHRVIDGFMAQTGDPSGKGDGGSGRNLAAEFTRTPQVRGVTSMARASSKDSADSQWFIVLTDQHRSDLDGKYTAWGEVVSGMELVDRIAKGDPKRNGKVAMPDSIVRMQVAADVDAPSVPAADILKRPEAAAEARDFDAMDFRCSVVNGRPGGARNAALAELWAQGFMAGAYKAQTKLSFDATLPADTTLREVCKAAPSAFLLIAGSKQLAGAPHPLPANTAAFSAADDVCKGYLAARGGEDTQKADLMDLWAVGFIEGFKNIGQPGMEIPYQAHAQLLNAVASGCTRNVDMGFADLVYLVSAKVRLK